MASFVYLLSSIKCNLFLLAPTNITFSFSDILVTQKITFLTYVFPLFSTFFVLSAHSHI